MTTAPATSEFALVDVGNVHPHPRNVRRELRGVDELAESIKTGGLHQPLVVAPALPGGGDDAGYILVMGHRRHAAAQSLGWSQVPCVIRHDLDTDAKVLEAMLAENMARSDLSPTEEGDAFQALLDLDVKPAKIAKAAGRSPKHVRDRVTVAAQPEKVRQAVDDRQITLANALTLAELADDHELYARVEQAIGTPRFDYEVERAVTIRANIKAERDKRTELTAAGYIEATETEMDSRSAPVDGHQLVRLWQFEPDQPEEELRFTLECPNPEYWEPRLLWWRLEQVEPEPDGDAGEGGAPAATDTAEAAQRSADADIAAAARRAAAKERKTAAARSRAHLSSLWNVDLQTADAVWAPTVEKLLRMAVTSAAAHGEYLEPVSELDVVIDPDSQPRDSDDPRLDPNAWSAAQLKFATWWLLWADGCEDEVSNFAPEHWGPDTATYLETLRDDLGYELSDIEDALLDTYHSIHSGDGDD